MDYNRKGRKRPHVIGKRPKNDRNSQIRSFIGRFSYPWNAPSCTIKENHGGVNLHPKLPRVLTAREMARLQSFPDDFIFEGKKIECLRELPEFIATQINSVNTDVVYVKPHKRGNRMIVPYVCNKNLLKTKNPNIERSVAESFRKTLADKDSQSQD